jgi:prolyl-tRNA synthetase
MRLAGQIHDQLCARGVEVLLDDRDERPGVKFKDSELIGFPIRLAIGDKSLAKGQVEFKLRAGQMTLLKSDEAVGKILENLAPPPQVQG